MKLTRDETLNVKYLLPIEGSLAILEKVEKILLKVDIRTSGSENIDIFDVDFTDEEISFLQEMIGYLDQAQKINIQCLSVVRKILNYKRSNENG